MVAKYQQISFLDDPDKIIVQIQEIEKTDGKATVSSGRWLAYGKTKKYSIKKVVKNYDREISYD